VPPFCVQGDSLDFIAAVVLFLSSQMKVQFQQVYEEEFFVASYDA
jgi:hypothetical protein